MRYRSRYGTPDCWCPLQAQHLPELRVTSQSLNAWAETLGSAACQGRKIARASRLCGRRWIRQPPDVILAGSYYILINPFRSPAIAASVRLRAPNFCMMLFT